MTERRLSAVAFCFSAEKFFVTASTKNLLIDLLGRYLNLFYKFVTELAIGQRSHLRGGNECIANITAG